MNRLQREPVLFGEHHQRYRASASAPLLVVGEEQDDDNDNDWSFSTASASTGNSSVLTRNDLGYYSVEKSSSDIAKVSVREQEEHSNSNSSTESAPFVAVAHSAVPCPPVFADRRFRRRPLSPLSRLTSLEQQQYSAADRPLAYGRRKATRPSSLPHLHNSLSSAMKALAQLKLLLWKTLLIRRRKPVLLILELCWPVFVFLVVVAIRLTTRLDNPYSCTFAPRTMPSGDLFSFMQSFLCNVDNSCTNETYDKPYYGNGKRSKSKFEKLVTDQRVGLVLRDLPHSLRLVNFIQDTLNKQDVRDLLEENFTIQNFLKYPREFEYYLVNQVGFSQLTVKAFYESAPNFAELFRLPQLINEKREEAICNASKLLSVLNLPTNAEQQKEKFSHELCARHPSEWAQILTKFYNALDFAKIIRLISKMTTIIGDYSLSDGLKDIAAMMDTVDKLKNVNSLTGTLAELKQTFRWIPEAFKMSSSMQNPSVDLNFLKSLIYDVETLIPKSNSDSAKITELLSMSRQVSELLKHGSISQSNLNLESIFGQQASKLGQILNVNNEGFGSYLQQLLSVPSLQLNNASRVILNRDAAGLQRLFCESKDAFESGDSSQFEEWKKIACTSNSTELWNRLLSYVNLTSLLNTMEEQKMTFNGWRTVGEAIKKLHLDSSESKRIRKIVKRSVDVKENFDFKLYAKAIEKIYSKEDSWQSVIFNTLNNGWSSVDLVLKDTTFWNTVCQHLAEQTEFYNWFSSTLNNIQNTNITLGNTLIKKKNFLEIFETTIQVFPTYYNAFNNAHPTDDLLNLLSQSKDLSTALKTLCTEKDLTKFYQVDSSFDRELIKDSIKFMCSIDFNILNNEVFENINYPPVNNEDKFNCSTNVTLSTYISATQGMLTSMDKMTQTIGRLNENYPQQISFIARVVKKTQLRRQLNTTSLIDTILSAATKSSYLQNFTNDSRIIFIQNGLQELCGDKSTTLLMSPVLTFGHLLLSIAKKPELLETLLDSNVKWPILFDNTPKTSSEIHYLKKLIQFVSSSDDLDKILNVDIASKFNKWYKNWNFESRKSDNVTGSIYENVFTLINSCNWKKVEEDFFEEARLASRLLNEGVVETNKNKDINIYKLTALLLRFIDETNLSEKAKFFDNKFVKDFEVLAAPFVIFSSKDVSNSLKINYTNLSLLFSRNNMGLYDLLNNMTVLDNFINPADLKEYYSVQDNIITIWQMFQKLPKKLLTKFSSDGDKKLNDNISQLRLLFSQTISNLTSCDLTYISKYATTIFDRFNPTFPMEFLPNDFQQFLPIIYGLTSAYNFYGDQCSSGTNEIDYSKRLKSRIKRDIQEIYSNRDLHRDFVNSIQELINFTSKTVNSNNNSRDILIGRIQNSLKNMPNFFRLIKQLQHVEDQNFKNLLSNFMNTALHNNMFTKDQPLLKRLTVISALQSKNISLATLYVPLKNVLYDSYTMENVLRTTYLNDPKLEQALTGLEINAYMYLFEDETVDRKTLCENSEHDKLTLFKFSQPEQKVLETLCLLDYRSLFYVLEKAIDPNKVLDSLENAIGNEQSIVSTFKTVFFNDHNETIRQSLDMVLSGTEILSLFSKAEKSPHWNAFKENLTNIVMKFEENLFKNANFKQPIKSYVDDVHGITISIKENDLSKLPIIVLRNLLHNETEFVNWLNTNLGLSNKQSQKLVGSHIRKKEVINIKQWCSNNRLNKLVFVGLDNVYFQDLENLLCKKHYPVILEKLQQQINENMPLFETTKEETTPVNWANFFDDVSYLTYANLSNVSRDLLDIKFDYKSLIKATKMILNNLNGYENFIGEYLNLTLPVSVGNVPNVSDYISVLDLYFSRMNDLISSKEPFKIDLSSTGENLINFFQSMDALLSDVTKKHDNTISFSEIESLISFWNYSLVVAKETLNRYKSLQVDLSHVIDNEDLLMDFVNKIYSSTISAANQTISDKIAKLSLNDNALNKMVCEKDANSALHRLCNMPKGLWLNVLNDELKSFNTAVTYLYQLSSSLKSSTSLPPSLSSTATLIEDSRNTLETLFDLKGSRPWYILVERLFNVLATSSSNTKRTVGEKLQEILELNDIFFKNLTLFQNLRTNITTISNLLLQSSENLMENPLWHKISLTSLDFTEKLKEGRFRSDRNRRMSEPFGRRLIEACEREQRQNVVNELPTVTHYISVLNDQLQSVIGYQHISCNASSKVLKELYDTLSVQFRKNLQSEEYSKRNRDDALPRDWKTECVSYVKNLEKLFDVSMRLSKQMKQGMADDLLECLKTTDNQLFVETGRYLDFFAAFGKMISDPFVFKNIQQIEPAVKYFFELVEKNAVAVAPLSQALRDGTGIQRRLASRIPKSLLQANVNLNQLRQIKSAEEMLIIFCNTNEVEKLLSPNTDKTTVQSFSAAFCQEDISRIIFDQIDRRRLDFIIPQLLREKMKSTSFFDEVVEQGTTLFNGFAQIADYLNEVPLLKESDNVWDSLAESGAAFLFSDKLDEIIPVAEDVLSGAKKLFGNISLYEDLQQLLQGVYGLDKVRRKVLILLSKNYPLKDLQIDPQESYRFMLAELNLSHDQAVLMLESDLSFQKLLSLVMMPLKPSGCNSYDSPLNRYFCDVPKDKINKFIKLITRNINPRPIVNEYVENELAPQIAKYGLPKTEIQQVWLSTKELPAVLPAMADALKADFYSSLPSNNNNMSLRDTFDHLSRLVCGRTLSTNFEQAMPMNDKAKKVFNQVDISEMNDLPSDFCRDVYRIIVQMPMGSAIWKFLKPLMRGRIAVAPKTPETMRIIELANKTFEQFQHLADLARSGVQSSESILRLNSSTDIKFITHALNHPLVGTILMEFAKVDSSQFMNALNGFKELDKSALPALNRLASIVANVTECISTDRFIFFDNELSMESAVRPLLNNDSLLAAIVFNFGEDKKSIKKRFVDQSKTSSTHSNRKLPKQIDYSIRMHPDRVPNPDDFLVVKLNSGKMSNAFQELQYLYGFSLIQDAIDTAIIEIQSDVPEISKMNTIIQQVPFPCADQDDFANHLTLWLPLFMVFAWMFCIGINVDTLTHESELGLSQMMRSMGLNGFVQWLSWFISSFTVTLIASVFIVILLKVGQILTYSNGFLILMLMIDFELAILMMSYLISVCFTKSTLATVSGIILYLMMYLPYIISTSPGHLLIFPLWAKLITCISAPTAFSFACHQLASWEERGLGLQFSNLDAGSGSGRNNEISFSWACLIILADSILYALIASYISHVRPKSGEPEKTLAFCIMPSFWKRIFSKLFGGEQKNKQMKMKTYIAHNFEESKIVSVQRLCKSYDNKKTCRVSDLTFDMHESEVTTLLGPNGAGKTSTINMLTGVCQPTSGTAYIYGRNIVTERSLGQALVGLCPQFNILFDHLTVTEHLEFYGKLKHLFDEDRLKKDIKKLLFETGLDKYADTHVYKLSGGTRRRVCTAVAFVGGSKFVVLDEPTAGVDPLARRQIWDIIKSQKPGRTVLLCTHFMDEAEELSDSVAILQKGKLLCCSTPQNLKNTFGYGSLLKVIRTKTIHGSTNTGVLLSAVKECIPDGQLVEDIGRVMCIVIPFWRNAVTERCKQIKNLSERLDSLKSYLGIENYEIRQSTLEEVVIIACKMSDLGLPLEANVKDRWKFLHEDKHYHQIKPYISSSSASRSDKKVDDYVERSPAGFKTKLCQFKALLYKRFLRTRRDWRLMISGILLPCLFVALAMACNILSPRQQAFSKIGLSPELYQPKMSTFFSNDDPNSNLTNRLIEGLFSSDSIGSWCTKLDKPDDCYSSFSNRFNSSDSGVFNDKKLYDKILSQCRCQYSSQVCPNEVPEGFGAVKKTFLGNKNYMYDLTKIQHNYGINNYLMRSHQFFLHTRYGGYSFGNPPHSNTDDDNVKPYVTIWFSNFDPHSLPAFQNGASNLRLRAAIKDNGSDYGITCYSHPFGAVENAINKENLLKRVADVGIALVLLAAYSLIPASLIIYVVQERTSKQRQLQKLSGVGDFLYWSTNFLWDFAFYTAAVLLGCVIIAIFKLPSFTDHLNLPATASLLILYGAAVLPLMYLMQSFFKDGTVAFVALFCFNLFTGINTMVCVMLLSFFSTSPELGLAASATKRIFLIFPQYAMGGGLVDLAYNQIQSEIYQSLNMNAQTNPFTFNVIGYNCLALFLEFVFFVIGAFVFQNFFCFSKTRSYCRDCCKENDDDEDEDVAAERKRVAEYGSGILLKVENLSKKYSSSKSWAVSRICFHLNRGECFGLLGLNGAGKTTTFEMLTGGIEPSFGTIYLEGEPIDLSSNRVRSDITYCPQENACDNLLTVRETLEIYGMLRGYHSKQLQEEVDSCINGLRLSKYENRLTGILSGGYKRLVCFAVSLLGHPKVILLDEPTAGMDPKTRRFVWERLSSELARGRAVFLSTHSMEDSERLCTRLAIMAGGRLRCLGSSTHLKTKFGYGYMARIQLHSPEQTDFIKEDLRHKFPSGTFNTNVTNEIQYFIPGNNVSLTTLYSWISSKSRLIANWDVVESNLDELFINFIKKLQEKDK